MKRAATEGRPYSYAPLRLVWRRLETPTVNS
jgi:hypothetical protein